MFQIFALFVLAVIEADCISLTIYQPASSNWNNEVSSCLSQGYKKNVKTFYLGQLSEFRLDYYDIDRLNKIHVRGDLSLTTGKEGTVPQSPLQLEPNFFPSSHIIFKGYRKLESSNWWAVQLAEMTIKIEVYKNGTVFLVSTVGATSSWALSCATTQANIESINIELHCGEIHQKLIPLGERCPGGTLFIPETLEEKGCVQKLVCICV